MHGATNVKTAEPLVTAAEPPSSADPSSQSVPAGAHVTRSASLSPLPSSCTLTSTYCVASSKAGCVSARTVRAPRAAPSTAVARPSELTELPAERSAPSVAAAVLLKTNSAPPSCTTAVAAAASPHAASSGTQLATSPSPMPAPSNVSVADAGNRKRLGRRSDAGGDGDVPHEMRPAHGIAGGARAPLAEGVAQRHFVRGLEAPRCFEHGGRPSLPISIRDLERALRPSHRRVAVAAGGRPRRAISGVHVRPDEGDLRRRRPDEAPQQLAEPAGSSTAGSALSVRIVSSFSSYRLKAAPPNL